MIDKFKILVPYVYGAGPSIGSSFDTKGKSVLVTGDMGMGKSSLLHMLARSIDINRKATGNAIEFGEYNPDRFYMDSPSADIAWTPTRREDFEGIADPGQEFLFNARLFKTSVPEQVLRDVYSAKLMNQRSRRSEKTWDETRYKSKGDLNQLVSTLDAIAKETKTPKEQVYGVAYLIALGHATRWKNPLTRFFHTQIQGNIYASDVVLDYDLPGTQERIVSILPSPKSRKNGTYSTEPYVDLDLGGLSAGQMQSAKLDEILSREDSIIMLDEPFAHLSEKAVNEYAGRLIDANPAKGKKRSQFVLTSHNPTLNEALRVQSDWVEINLDN